ncbi:hypothetical protein KAR48_10805 [bacterium]|nr:hypothetical protein [bacterium]
MPRHRTPRNDTYGLNVVSAGEAFVQATAAVSSRLHQHSSISFRQGWVASWSS